MEKFYLNKEGMERFLSNLNNLFSLKSHSHTKSEVGLGNVGNYKAVSTVASQGLTDSEKSNARSNISAAASSHAHNYAGSTSAGGDANNAKKLGGFPVSSGSNQVYGTVPTIGSDGVIEIGKYIDFHTSASSTNDYDVRITADSNGLSFATPSGNATINGYSINKSVPSNAKFTDTTYSNATTSSSGLMSSTDKSNFDKMYKVTTITSATDWNTLTSTGIYHIKTTSCTNCPTTNWGTLYVNGEGTVFQIWIPDVNLTSIYKRYNSGGWSSWKEQKLTDTVTTDSGWQTISSFGTNIKAYTGKTCRYRKIGKMVEICATFTCSASLSLPKGTSALLATLPSGYRPSESFYTVQQGTDTNRWACSVDANGKIQIERYGTTTFTNPGTGTWFPCQLTFFTDS